MKFFIITNFPPIKHFKESKKSRHSRPALVSYFLPQEKIRVGTFLTWRVIYFQSDFKLRESSQIGCYLFIFLEILQIYERDLWPTYKFRIKQIYTVVNNTQVVIDLSWVLHFSPFLFLNEENLKPIYFIFLFSFWLRLEDFIPYLLQQKTPIRWKKNYNFFQNFSNKHMYCFASYI